MSSLSILCGVLCSEIFSTLLLVIMFKIIIILPIVGYVTAVTLQDLINQHAQIATQNAINFNGAVRNSILQSVQANPISFGYAHIVPSVYTVYGAQLIPSKGPVSQLQCQYTTAYESLEKRDYIKEAENKELVLKFLQKVFAEKNFDAIDEYISENYIQHDHDIADGKEAIREAVKQWLKDVPKREKLDIKRVAADGELVWVHLRGNLEKWGGSDEAIIDIFRVENGKIAEHWDVYQSVPKTPSKNNNTIF